MQKILLVEDDNEISEMLCDYLKGESFVIDAAFDGEEALKCFNKNSYDLALIDLMIPKISGMEIIKEIRKNNTIPIIIITAKDSDMDKTLGFNLGADDYLTKPFSLIELTARIKANIRRSTKYSTIDKEKQDVIKIKDLMINTVTHMVECRGLKAELTYTEFELLKKMAARPGQAFSKEQLYESIWNEAYYGNENVLNTHINRLRRKLKTLSNEEYIKTLWGIGYKMEEK